MNFQSGPACGRARSGVAFLLMLSDSIVPSFSRCAILWNLRNLGLYFPLLFFVRCLCFCLGVFVLVSGLYWLRVLSPFFFLHVLFSHSLIFVVFAACWPPGHAATADGAHILLIANTFVSVILGLPT